MVSAKKEKGSFKYSKEEGMLHFLFILGFVSPERMIEHRQAVKRSETPAMCRKLTEY